MQIIFDEKLVPVLREKHPVLELDTIWQPGMSEPITLHAVIERVALNDIASMELQRELHEGMIRVYKSGEWEILPLLIEQLKGKWQGELDTFYDEILDFISRTDPKDWDGIRRTMPTTD
jgi:hypothetical protein